MAHLSDLRFALVVAGDLSLDVVRFDLEEGISQPFRLELDLSSFDAAIDANALLDREAVFTIERNGIAERTVVGIVTSFQMDEAGFQRTRYRAVVESPLARLALRHNSRIFQRVNATEVLATLLKDNAILGSRTTYFATHEPREYCVQYRETDAALFHRLATEEGIVHWHEFVNGHGTLVLSDKVGSAPTLPEHAPVLYQPASAGDAPGPHLSRFAYRRQLAPTRITQREYSFHNPRYNLQHGAKAWALEEAVGDYEHYDYAGRYKHDEAGKPFTRNRLSGLRNAADQAAIAGDDARLFPGLAFDLTGHTIARLNDCWRVVSMHHIGEQATSQETDGFDAEPGTSYRYEAIIVPAHYDWKPEPAPRPVVDGPQVAHVVGPEGEEIHCDEHGRVQVWFPWDREGPRENATCWIRVSQGWAGTMYGFMALPRVGHEVIVSFLEGDPDQPIITGRAYHAANRPPYKLPMLNTLTTFKSQEHQGSGHNELLIDDTSGELKAQLKSTHAATQLNLGYLTHPRDDRGSGRPRGEGFELRTDASGALRAARGLLLTAYERSQAGSGQLDHAELVQCVATLTDLVCSLTDIAAAHQALPIDHASRQELAQSLEHLGAGANDHAKESGGKPLLAMTAPDGVVMATPASVLIGAGRQLDVVTEGAQYFTAAQTQHFTAGQGISQFAIDGGLTQIAHRDDVRTQAQHGNVIVEAEQNIRHNAGQQMLLFAGEKMILGCGQSGMVFNANGRIEMFGTEFIPHARFERQPPVSMQSAAPQFGQINTAGRFALVQADGTTPVPGQRYRIALDNGQIVEGLTDAQGLTEMLQHDALRIANIEVFHDSDDK